MFGDQPSIADIALACEITSVYAMDYPLDQNFKSISKWFNKEMLKLQGFKKVHDEGTAKLKFVLGYVNKIKE